MIGYLIHLVIGSATGWLVAIVMRTTPGPYWILNIALGIIGAFLAGRLIPGASLADGVTVRALFASLAGAAVLPAEIGLLFGRKRRRGML